MRRSIFVLFFLMMFGGVSSVFGQEEEINSIEIDTTDLGLKYFGNRDYSIAQKYYDAGDLVECRHYFEKATQSFRGDENWEAYEEAMTTYIKSFRSTKDFEIGVEIGNTSVGILKKECQSSSKNKYIAMLYFNIGLLYDYAYKPQDARSYLYNALKFEKEYYGDDVYPSMGVIYNQIAISYAKIGNLDKGLEYFLKAEDVYLKSKEGQEIVKKKLPGTIGNIGVIFFNKGNYEKALIYMEKGLEEIVRTQEMDNPDFIISYYNISNIYNILGEHSLSNDYLKKALSIVENLKTKYPREALDFSSRIHNNLGINYLGLNESEKAIFHFNKAEKIVENDSIISPALLEIKANGGAAYFKLGKYEEALSKLYIADSLATIYKRENKEHTRLLYEIKFHIAEVLTIKEEYANARKYLQQSFFEVLESERSGNYETAKSNLEIGITFEKEQQLDSTLFYVQKALIDFSRTFRNPDFAAYPTVDDIKENNEIFRILENKARFAQLKAEEDLSRIEKKEYYGIALAAIDLADQLHSKKVQQQGSLRGSQLKSLLEISLPFYRTGLDILAGYSEILPEKERTEKAFYFTQKMKARQLWATQLGSEAKQLGKIDKEILEKEQQLLSDIQYYEKQVKTAAQNEDAANLDLYQNTYLFNTKNDYRNLLAEIEKNYPDFFETKFAFNPAILSDIQSTLKEDEIVLEYTFSDEDYVYLFVIEKEAAPQFLKISIDAQTDKNISRLTKMLRKSSMERNTSREKFIKLSHALYKQFVEPAKESIVGKNRLIIIGEGKTNYIPFEALVQSDELKPFTDLDYLLTDYEVSYHYSSTLFTKSRKQVIASSNAGIFAFAPVYENGMSPSVANPKRSVMESDSTLRAFDPEGNFTPLPESEKEVKAIANLFKQKGIEKLNIALRKDANEENLKSNLQQSYQYIHIAGHSFANLKNPKFSGIACFQEEKDAKEDGILYAGEIYNLSTKADLFTLSSCESGFGKLEETEGLLGLNRAFIYAGAPNVTFSLWKIYDNISAQCMIDFYREILKDKSYAAALRQAKLNLLKKEETASPHYWSPFLLIGR